MTTATYKFNGVLHRLSAVLLTSCLVLFGALIGASPDARAATPQETAALETATNLVNDAYGALTTGGVGDAERFRELQTVIDGAFAFDVWEKFMLGDDAEQFSEEQLTSFRDLLPKYLARLYANNFGRGMSQEPKVLSARTVRRDVVVAASIPRDRGDPLPVEYRIRDFSERGPLVIDVMVAGASFLLLKRDEFSSVIKNNGPDGLIEYMKDFSEKPAT